MHKMKPLASIPICTSALSTHASQLVAQRLPLSTTNAKHQELMSVMLRQARSPWSLSLIKIAQATHFQLTFIPMISARKRMISSTFSDRILPPPRKISKSRRNMESIFPKKNTRRDLVRDGRQTLSITYWVMDQQIDSYHHFIHQQPFYPNSTECSLLLAPFHSPNSSPKHSLQGLHLVMLWMVTGITMLRQVAPKPTHMVSQSSTISTPGMVSGNILVTGSGSNSVLLFPHSPFSFLLTSGL